MKTDSTALLIQKEVVPLLHFPKEDVLFSKEEILKREKDLHKAETLGNIDHIKIKIFFQDVEGDKVVDTTIWAVTDKAIILKKSAVIPIHRISRIVI